MLDTWDNKSRKRLTQKLNWTLIALYYLYNRSAMSMRQNHFLIHFLGYSRS